MKFNFKLTALLLALSSTAFAAAPAYKIVDTIAIGGAAKWDYLYVDSEAHRLYVTHGTQTEVIDTQTNKVVGTIANTQGVHGVAIARELGIGFTSDGVTDSVSVFDLATLKVSSSIKVGTKPDAIVYAPVSQKLVAFNGKSNNASIIDAKTLKVIATVAVAGKPEFAVVGADGNVYFNLEDVGQISSINLATNTVSQTHSLKPCEEPTGLAMDDKQHLFSVCANNLMMVSTTSGKVIAQPAIGSGPDGVAFMDGYAFSANGADGNMTVVGEVNGKFQAVATIPTQVGARTIAADPATHRLYLPTADFKAAQGTEKRQGIPDTFRVLVLQQQ
ncbi:YncE family protein [Solimicrobium silvestre]|uniref:40-residue YVTN family beta-propeller repeat protein n=1 Tax=Solimicrobium silvestre TaxID=2099400 RepID=A0A2S9GZR8_9BURK|nr:YncE family protein [Solimicrobium silvestre]PRC93221.1 40-residue YVTN family beta-propeller repeat protein [Solimicrobium silvestre]